LFWCAIYALEAPRAFVSLLRSEPVALLFEGTRVHLWFLVSLLLAVCMFALWVRRRGIRSFLVLGAILYAIGLLAGAYKVTPIGFDIHFQTRNGIFFTTLYFAIGVAFFRKEPRVSTRISLGLVFGGLALFCIEAALINRISGVSPASLDYLVGSVPFGVGVALLALAQPASSIDRLVAPLGRYALGVYASHMLFVDLLWPIGAFAHPLVWQPLFPLLVFGLSLFTAIILGRTSLRRVVM
jgi:surface polysaccharide O-acyltransferase-like enzyme